MLLYRSLSWVGIEAILKVLGDFHQRASWKIPVMTARYKEDGEWEYLPVADALEAAGIWRIKE